MSAAFAKTNIGEMQRLVVFPSTLYHVLRKLLDNGLKPNLRQRRYSMKQMRTNPSQAAYSSSVQERITHETARLLKAMVEAKI